MLVLLVVTLRFNGEFAAPVGNYTCFLASFGAF